MKSTTIFIQILVILVLTNIVNLAQAQDDFEFYQNVNIEVTTEEAPINHLDEAYLKSHLFDGYHSNITDAAPRTIIHITFENRDYADDFASRNSEYSSTAIKTYTYQKVADVALWKQAYKDLENIRVQHGELSAEYGVLAGSPNTIYIINTWLSKEDFQRYMAQPMIDEAMKKAGVLEDAHVHILAEQQL